ncbi:hypothetical protein [Thioclava atlantica]|uniref:DUF4760 domain-containing protein n=1 Tax=Thioclava atlantica TaxID=1317124 RepID=A0A085TZ16_9RHOB|nr:hypothetical protein [Thioclava atlantica]KFE35963.1 hypothetical protein DW2_05020 [Thioclava atlantica]
MTWETAIVGALGLIASLVSFVGGKIFSQSENILDRKREAYKAFLRFCPAPNEAHDAERVNTTELQREIGILTVYASRDVLKFAAAYFTAFAEAQEKLVGVEIAGHPAFIKLMTDYNRMVWAMRNDAMMWSVFAPSRQGRDYRPSLDPSDFE